MANEKNHFHQIIPQINKDIGRKLHAFKNCEWQLIPISLCVLPKVSASDSPFTPLYNITPEVAETVANYSGRFYIERWVQRGRLIRAGHTNAMCLGNLTYALSLVNELNQAEYGGAAGALTLLPTVSTLLGAPAKELWVVYKLVPLAGLLTMMLSLGGTITPSQVRDYDPSVSYHYGGLITTEERDEMSGQKTPDPLASLASPAQRFARQVAARAASPTGNSSYAKIWLAMAGQASLIAVILIAMWYAQLGSVIPWWCRFWGWMWGWYALVSAASILENLAHAPFTKTWTMRISRAPATIEVCEHTPSIVRPNTSTGSQDSIVGALHKGVNVRSRVSFAPDRPYSESERCFYVVICKEGISNPHAFAQIVTKSITCGVFAFGTALFASATLMSLATAVMILALVIMCALIGRILALWIAADMNYKNQPILNTIAKNKAEVEEYLQEILSLPDLIIEIKGHIIINSKVVHRRSEWWCLATYIGLLSKPFDLRKIAVQRVPGFLNRLPTGSTVNSSLIRGFTGLTHTNTDDSMS